MTKAQTNLLTEANWWIAHQALMDYAEVRPVPFKAIKAHTRCATDCSGSITGIFKALDLPDPCGGDYTNELIYTGTMLAASDKIASVTALGVGDFVIWAKGPNTTHVAMVIKPGADPLLFSHGQEAGPIAIRYSAETSYHTSVGATTRHYCRPSLPADTPAPVWHVSSGNGTQIAKTRTPRLWTLRHRVFRTHDVVTYRKAKT